MLCGATPHLYHFQKKNKKKTEDGYQLELKLSADIQDLKEIKEPRKLKSIHPLSCVPVFSFFLFWLEKVEGVGVEIAILYFLKYRLSVFRTFKQDLSAGRPNITLTANPHTHTPTHPHTHTRMHTHMHTFFYYTVNQQFVSFSNQFVSVSAQHLHRRLKAAHNNQREVIEDAVSPAGHRITCLQWHFFFFL